MKKVLCFDDVLLEPSFSDLSSRKQVDLSTSIGGLRLKLPVMSAPMDTVTTPAIAKLLHQQGGIATLHRFSDIGGNVAEYQASECSPIVSVGLNDWDRVLALRDAGADKFCLDVANGAQQQVVDWTKEFRRKFGNSYWLMIGNFATGAQIQTFIERLGAQGVDAWRLGVGSGCFAGDTRVLMANGTYRDIKDIKVHDWVINKDGKPVEVIGVKFSGLKKTMKYKNSKWYKNTVCTPDHRHWAYDFKGEAYFETDGEVRGIDSKTPTWVAAESLETAVMTFPKEVDFSKMEKTFKINLSDFSQSNRSVKNKVIYSDIEPSYELGYLFGAFLGDGHARVTDIPRGTKESRNLSYTLNFYFGKHEMDIANKVVKYFETIFGYSPKIKSRRNMLVVEARRSQITRLFLTLGKKTSKKLPNEYMINDAKYLKGLVDGLIDSDGHVEESGRTTLTNTSAGIMEQYFIANLIANGEMVSMKHRMPPKDHKFGDTSNWSVSYMARSAGTKEKQGTLIHNLCRVNDLTEIDELFIPTYDIEVNCETSSFIANNAAVHNSACTTRIKTGCGLPTLATVLSCQGIDNLVADGGIKTPGDAAKALAAGAKCVMIGSMLAGTDETGTLTYRGSASKESYGVQGKLQDYITAEGESFTVKPKGPAINVLKDLEGGLRSAFTYVGSQNLAEFHRNAVLVEVTSNSVKESKAHFGS